MNIVLDVLAKTFDYSGRARRTEYWVFVAVMLALMSGLYAAEVALGLVDQESDMGILTGLFMLATFLPSLAVAVRRLHDSGKAGWWYLMIFVPFVGPLVLFVFMLIAGTPGTNKYGQDPRGR